MLLPPNNIFTLDKWDAFFFAMAATASRLSKDPSTKVGAVIENGGKIISSGFNGFPKGYPDREEFLKDRDLKIKLVEHAERNAISQALHNSGTISGGTIYITHCPCRDCAKGIIQAGLSVVKFPYYPEFEKRWEFDFTHDMLRQCGLAILKYDPGEIREKIRSLFDIDMNFLPGERFDCTEC